MYICLHNGDNIFKLCKIVDISVMVLLLSHIMSSVQGIRMTKLLS